MPIIFKNKLIALLPFRSFYLAVCQTDEMFISYFMSIVFVSIILPIYHFSINISTAFNNPIGSIFISSMPCANNKGMHMMMDNGLILFYCANEEWDCCVLGVANQFRCMRLCVLHCICEAWIIIQCATCV